MKITLRQGIGYAGRLGNRAYVARILGTSNQYGFDREFIDADSVERDHFGRARYIRTYTYLIGPGLYEIESEGERRYRIVYIGLTDGHEHITPIEIDRVEAIARLMTDGQDYDAARVQTKPPQPTV